MFVLLFSICSSGYISKEVYLKIMSCSFYCLAFALLVTSQRKFISKLCHVRFTVIQFIKQLNDVQVIEQK